MFDVNAQLDAANSARDQQRWGDAARLYRRYLLFKRNEADVWVQLGNMLKEDRQLDKSLNAYCKALAIGMNNSDIHLQIGHLRKVMGEYREAINSYLRALEFLPLNLNAFEELERMGHSEEAIDIITKNRSVEQQQNHLIVFDVSDLVFYIGHHDNLSGIQRVQCCVIQAVLKHGLHDPRDLRFISYDRELRSFRSICPDRFLALLDDLAFPKERRRVEFDSVAARHGRLFPQEPLAAFIRPGRTTVALLGAAWVIPEYATLVANLKRIHGARFAMLFHDFIPIYARETCDQGTAEVFKEFVDQILPITDLAMCVSRSTERDLTRYCRDTGCQTPPTLVTQLGTSFDEFFPRAMEAPRSPPRIEEEPYVLFVSTIEGRKNHNYMFETWQRLVERGVEVPRLICVGRIGWRAEAFLTNLLETDYLGGRIELREDVSDEELSALYRGCLFTVFPSLYEGWGLPVGESLGHGKLCVLAENSSLPEVAGEFGYFLPMGDAERSADSIAALLGDPKCIAGLEHAIATRFVPLRWEDIAQRVVEGCLALQREQEAANEWPLATLGDEYTLKKLRGSFGGLLGRAMLEAVEASFAAPLLGGTAKLSQRVGGLLARDGNWHAAEDWGSWALRQCAGLQFAIDCSALAEERELVLYGKFRFIDNVGGARLRLLVAGAPVGNDRMVEGGAAVLAWQLPVAELRRRGRSLTNGALALDLRFQLTDVPLEALNASLAIDPRGLAFGLKSFVLLGASDVAERVRIAERNSFKVVCL